MHIPWNKQVGYFGCEGFMTVTQYMIRKIVCNGTFDTFMGTFPMAIEISKLETSRKELREELRELEEVKGECMLPRFSESFIEVLD